MNCANVPLILMLLLYLRHVVSDGGCTCPGDFSKAFGAGGDFVMAGGMFAGHEESGGELVQGADGKMYKEFYGAPDVSFYDLISKRSCSLRNVIRGRHD